MESKIILINVFANRNRLIDIKNKFVVTKREWGQVRGMGLRDLNNIYIYIIDNQKAWHRELQAISYSTF